MEIALPTKSSLVDDGVRVRIRAMERLGGDRWRVVSQTPGSQSGVRRRALSLAQGGGLWQCVLALRVLSSVRWFGLACRR